MKLGSSKGAKTGVWFPNEILHVDDINFIGEGTYQNITDMLAALAEQGVAAGATKDIVIAGLLLEWNNLLTSDLRAGMAISYSGYYMASDGTWGFQASSGDIFSVLVSADQAVAVDPGGAQARYDTIEIRPVQVQYDSKSRAFKDPVTGLVTSSPVDTKIEYGYEFQVLKGAGGGVAPTHTAGWIKIVEVFVDVSATAITQNDIRDVRDSDLWTTEANDVKYKEAFVGEKVTSSPTGGTATSLSKIATIKGALVEVFARLRNLSGVQNNAVVNRHIGPLAVRQAEIDLGVDAGDVDADVVPLGSVVSSSPTGGTATNLAASSYVRAALQEILNRLKNLSGVSNDSVDSRHYAHNSIDEEHMNWGLAAGQIDAAHLPIADGGSKIVATEVEGALQENRTAIDVSEADIVSIESAIAAINALDPGHTISGDVSGSGAHINLGTASITLTIGALKVLTGMVANNNITMGKIAKGTLDTYIKGQGGSNSIYEKLHLADTGIHIQNNTRSSSGGQVISGVGFQPSIVIIFATMNATSKKGMSQGFGNTAANHCIAQLADGTNYHSATLCVYVEDTNGNDWGGAITSLGSDGFTITWTMTGLPGSVYFTYLCLP